MDRVRNEEVRRRACIEREFSSRADQRVLKCFGTWRAKVSGVRVRGRPRLGWMYGWCEGGFGPQRDDGVGCATMRERYNGVESPGAYVDDSV